ncbi:ABC transporter substrate-binding protein [Glutamicibacter arilaitensis]|uniref:ABC transporter substrate-binding protein n=1 Tax=Glutamicibacter arilaitensis TaxID=256701 RepID=UPI00385175DC
MKMNKKATLKLGGLLTVGLLLLSACGGSETEAGTGSEEMPSITIAVTPSVNGLGVATAYQEGLFEEAGLDVTIEKITSGTEGAALLAGGDAQFAQFSMDNAINSVIEGHNNVITVPLAGQSPERGEDPHGFGSIIVDIDSDIQSLKDLEGERIGTSVLGGEAYLNAYQTLEEEGVDISTIEWIQIPGPQHVSAVLQGQVAAAITPEPNLSIAVLEGTIAPIADVTGALPNAPSFGLASDSDWASANPQIVLAVLNSVLKANAMLNSDRELAEEAMKEYMIIDDEVAEMVRLPVFPVEELTVTQLEPVVDRLINFDQISEADVPNLEDVVFSAE